MWRKILLVLVLICACSGTVLAQTKEPEGSTWGDAGWGVLTVGANLFYVPAKVLYAGAGAVTGGLAYALTVGDRDTAEKIWAPSLGGNYVVTPSMVRGDDPVHFSGPDYPKQ